MGGQAYLTRLAFGRSAYEPVQSAEPHNWTKAGSAEPSEDVPYPQSYDNKGNPISIKTVRRSAAQIAAKNEVLAAVGVCEKKNNEARLFSSEGTYSEEEWKSIRVAENSVEFVGRVMAAISRHGATWWLVALRRRVQAGIIRSDQPFSQILTYEWYSITSRSPWGAVGRLMVGTIPDIAEQLVTYTLESFIEELNIWLQELPYKLHLRRPQRKMMLLWIERLNVVLLIACHILISPLQVYAYLQEFGLLESIPLLDLILPWRSSSPLRWAFVERGDSLPLGSRLLSVLLSPASLYAFSTILSETLELNYGHTPFCSDYMILGPCDDVRKPREEEWPAVFHDERPSIFSPLLNLRDSILRKLGWSQRHQKTVLSDNSDDNNTRITRYHSDGTSTEVTQPPTKRTYRDSELAKFPSFFLSLNLNSLAQQIVFMPFESLFSRSLLSSFLASPLAGSRKVNAYPPGRGPFGSLLRSGVGVNELRNAGGYANKIGMCLALHFTVDMVVWAGMYAWVRGMGVGKFDWGFREPEFVIRLVEVD